MDLRIYMGESVQNAQKLRYLCNKRNEFPFKFHSFNRIQRNTRRKRRMLKLRGILELSNL